MRLGEGILHSMLKATQLVQGTPRLAASQRTWETRQKGIHGWGRDMLFKRTFREWHVCCRGSACFCPRLHSWSYLASSRGALSEMVASVLVQRISHCLVSRTSGNSWQRLLAGSCPLATVAAEHAEVWCVVWAAAAGMVLVAAEVVERTLRRRKGGRPWKYRYSSLVALVISTRPACRLWRVPRSS